MDPREIARVSLRFHFAPAKPSAKTGGCFRRCLLPLFANRILFPIFKWNTRLRKGFPSFLIKEHFKHTFSRYQNVRETGYKKIRNDGEILVYNVHDVNGNSSALFIFLERKLVTRSYIYVIRNILIMVVVYRNFPKDLKIVEKLRRKFLLESSDSLLVIEMYFSNILLSIFFF